MLKLLGMIIFPLLLTACQKHEAVKIQGNVIANIVASKTHIDFEEKLLAFKYTQTLTLTNDGSNFTATEMTGSVFESSGPFNYTGDIWPGVNGTCGTTLSAGESCTLEIEFFPESEQNSNDALGISYSNGLELTSLSIPLTGYGGNVANLTATPDTISYSVLEPLSYREAVITLQNAGGLPALNMAGTFDELTAYNFKGGFYPGLGGTCGPDLRQGQSCTLVIQYYPQAIGNFNTDLNIAFTNPANPVSLPISLTGIAASIEGDLRFLNGSTLLFLDTPQGGRSTKQVTLSNSGYLDAQNISISITGNYSLASTTCGLALTVSSNCVVVVNFNPAIVGQESGSIVVSYNSGKSVRTTTLATSGVGLTPGVLSFSIASPYEFGSIGVHDTALINFAVTNLGDLPVTALSLAALAAPYTISASNCPAVMAPLQSCSLSVAFDPSTAQTFTESIVLNYHNGVGAVSKVMDLSGTGIPIAVLKYSAAGFSFGTGPVNEILKKEITITNIGVVDATAMSIINLSSYFGYEGGSYPGTLGSCGSTLPPGESCTIKLTAFNAIKETINASLVMSYNNGQTQATARTSLLAIFQNPATLGLANGPSGDFGSIALGSSQIKIYTLFNSGDYTAVFDSPISLQSGAQQFTLDLQFNRLDSGFVVCDGLTFLLPNQGCYLKITFNPIISNTYNDNLILDYHDITSAESFSFSLTGVGIAKALVEAQSYATNFVSTPRGGFQDINFTLKNNGNLSATSLVISAPTDIQTNPAASSASVQSHNCPSTLAVNSTCLVTLRFAPTANGTYLFAGNWSFYDGTETVASKVGFSMVAVNPANLSITPNGMTDWGLVVVNNNANKNFTIQNNGGVNGTGLVINGLSAPFSIASNSCGTTAIIGGCSITIRFSPTDIGILHSNTVNVTYNDGVTGKTTNTITLQGTGEPPLSVHRGWSMIKAWGSKVSTTNVSNGDAQIAFSWNAMIPQSGSITGYNVYRKLASAASFDFASPVASNVTTDSRTFTDTSIAPSTVYEYMVKPINMGLPSRTTQTFNTLRVIAPPNNMVLVHRFMANTLLCNRLGLTVNTALNHGCYYSGLGKTASDTLDLGYDLLVDRFETGLDGTPRTNQAPLASLSQVSAWNSCINQSGIGLAGVAGTFSKRLLKRREFVLASAWPSTLTASQITSIESGTTGSQDCNGDGSGVENIGNNINCTSYFGASDTSGNSWEWVSDRVFDGKGISLDNMRLDPNNRDLDNIDFTSHTNKYLDDYECFNEVFGLPLFSSGGGSCGENTSVSSLGAANLHDDYFFTPGSSGLKVALVGGGFSNIQYSGSHTFGFFSTSLRGAARCGIQVP